MKAARGNGERKSRIVSVGQPYSNNNSRGGGEGSKRVYVGNLDWDVSWQDLKDHMKIIGPVLRANVLEEARGGRSKGCGIVEFENEKDAKRAITNLNDTILKGRKIFVREDRENGNNGGNNGGGGDHGGDHSSRPVREGGGGGSGGGDRAEREIDLNKIIVAENLPLDYSWQDLKDLMRPIGAVIRTDIIANTSGESTGLGIVEFKFPDAPNNAIHKLNNTTVKDDVISIRLANEDDNIAKLRTASSTTTNNNNNNNNRNNNNNNNNNNGGGYGGGGGGNGRKLYVSQLAWSVAWQDLKDHFKAIGPVIRSDVAQAGGRSKGFGFIEYEQAGDAERAIRELNESVLHGRKIYVREDREETR